MKRWIALSLATFSVAAGTPAFGDSFSVQTFSAPEQPLFLNDLGDLLFANDTILHANGATTMFSNPPGSCNPDFDCYDQVQGFNNKDQVFWSRQNGNWAYYQLSSHGWQQLSTKWDIIGGGQNQAGNNQNNAGQIIGFGNNGSFIYNNGKYDYPRNQPNGFMFTSLNDAGQAVGFVNPNNGASSTDYLYSGGKLIKVAYPGAATQYFYPDPVIGPAGQVADVSSLGLFLYQNGRYYNLDLPATNTLVQFDSILGIDKAGQVLVAYTQADGTQDDYFYENGRFVILNDPSSRPGSTRVTAFNSSTGEVILHSSAGYSIYENGVYSPLTIPGFSNPSFVSINAKGQILGFANAPGNQDEYFLASPIEATPEPATLVLTLSGLLGACLFRLAKT